MPNKRPQNKDFAHAHTDSFELAGEEASAAVEKKDVILNIEKTEDIGVSLQDQRKEDFEYSGNFFKDFFLRINYYLVSHSKITIKDKATFFHLLSVMVNAGVPMIKALNSLIQQMEKSPKMRMVIKKIRNNVESGASLSEAMVMMPDDFIESEVGMVRSGEASGQISGILENLGEDLEKSNAIRSKVKMAMLYPIIVFILLVGVVAAMMIFVVPKLKSLFSMMGGELPLITRIVVGISDFFVAHQSIMSIGIFSILVLFSLAKKTAPGKYAFDKFKISVPIFGALYKKAYLANFARSMSNLLDSNLSIVKAIEITGNSVGNEVYRKRLLLSSEDVKQGIPMGESLADSPLFPPVLVNMIEVGESTAQLPEIMTKVSKFYEDEVDTAVAGISKIIEPVILVAIGLSVGAVVAAIMIPIMNISNMTGGM